MMYLPKLLVLILMKSNLAEHPENSFSDRCEEVQMFYFEQNWNETLDKIDQALSGIIKYQDDNFKEE